MKIRFYSIAFLSWLFISFPTLSTGQLMGIELEPGQVDTVFNLYTLKDWNLCQGQCYQFRYLVDPYRLTAFDYFEDSIYWKFNLGIPNMSRERDPYVCFPNLGGPDTIAIQQQGYNRLVNRLAFVGQGHRAVYVIKCKPVAAFEVDREVICVGESIRYRDSSLLVPDQWVWQFEGGEPAEYFGPDPPPIHYYTPGLYTTSLSVANEAGGDTEVKQQLIEVKEGSRPITDRDIDLTGDFGSIIAVPPCAHGDSYVWSPPEDLSCVDCPDPELKIGHISEYSLVVGLDGFECKDTCNYRILVRAVDENIWFPTAFTPNGDGINDYFEAYGNHVEIEELRIFDRWGNLLFSGRDQPRWDGTVRGQPVDSGAYVFYAIYRKLYTQETDIISGEVTVYR